jgi:uncharacterized membrane protein
MDGTDNLNWPGAFRAKFLSVLALVLLALLALPAFARNWHISDFHDTITVSPDGSVFVQERITLVFEGQYHGIHRVIPTEYPGPGGTNYSLYLHVEGVTDDAGRSLKHESKRDGPNQVLTVYIPDAEDATRTVTISYLVQHAVKFFPDYDELYWNVTGNDWAVPIDHASAVIGFPEGAAGGLRAQAFTGVYGSREQDATAAIEGAQASFETTAPLPMRGGLTLDVSLPPGVIHAPGALTQVLWFLRANAVLFLPTWTLVVMFAIWWRKGRDPDPGMSVAPMYEPPEGISPAEAGTLVADAVEPRDITSTVVDLAVHGYIRIEETSEPHLLHSNKDYVFHLLKPQTLWGDLRPHEQVMMAHFFETGQSVRMSDLKNRFYVAIPPIKQDILAALKQKGMYSIDPDKGKGYVVLAAVLAGVPFLLLQRMRIFDFTESGSMLALAIVLSVLILILFGRKLAARSLLGVRTRVKILGFQEFMNRVDAERLKRMPPDTFERFLPYAMALGVEHAWAQAFKGLLTQPPQWYTGAAYPGAYWTPIVFANSMHAMSTDLHTVMTMAPRSSAGGSGFGGGGGGFSGGGFGGGGGGAF